MRELKFRAWNVVTKTMIDLKKVTPLALNMDTDGLFIPFSDGFHIMQYTGLKDKNGVEIFEGDIVECCTRNYEVFYYEELTRFRLRSDNISYFVTREMGEHFLKVIGNIHENPELLEA